MGYEAVKSYREVMQKEGCSRAEILFVYAACVGQTTSSRDNDAVARLAVDLGRSCHLGQSYARRRGKGLQISTREGSNRARVGW
jgi:hypothetical protein